MTSTTHSPGPWGTPERPERDAFEPDYGHTTVPMGFTLIQVDPGDDFDGSNYIEVHGPNQKANAQLVTAAPDLLAALKTALRAPGIHTTDQETGETFSSVIEAAIQKADGRA